MEERMEEEDGASPSRELGSSRVRPNILITGTPGTGKTSTSSMLARSTGFSHICVGDLIKEKELHTGWDEEFDCHIVDEDKLCDELEDRLVPGGFIVDYHICDIFPARWFDAVVVLRTDNSVLYDRLIARGYGGKKLENNMEAEIMQVILEDAMESYDSEIVRQMQSNTVADMERNVDSLSTLLQSWRPHASGGA